MPSTDRLDGAAIVELVTSLSTETVIVRVAKWIWLGLESKAVMVTMFVPCTRSSPSSTRLRLSELSTSIEMTAPDFTRDAKYVSGKSPFASNKAATAPFAMAKSPLPTRLLCGDGATSSVRASTVLSTLKAKVCTSVSIVPPTSGNSSNAVICTVFVPCTSSSAAMVST